MTWVRLLNRKYLFSGLQGKIPIQHEWCYIFSQEIISICICLQKQKINKFWMLSYREEFCEIFRAKDKTTMKMYTCKKFLKKDGRKVRKAAKNEIIILKMWVVDCFLQFLCLTKHDSFCEGVFTVFHSACFHISASSFTDDTDLKKKGSRKQNSVWLIKMKKSRESHLLTDQFIWDVFPLSFSII